MAWTTEQRYKRYENWTTDEINQIKEKNYAAEYNMDGKKIVLIGSSFDEQTRTIKEWAVANS